MRFREAPGYIVLRLRKRTFLAASCLVTLATIFAIRGPIFRAAVCYRCFEPPERRGAFELTDGALTKQLKAWADRHQGGDMETTIRYALAVTAENLKFGRDGVPDPSEFVKTKKAHCVGYAAFFKAVLDCLIQRQGNAKAYVVEHKVAKIHVLGFNIHAMLGTSAFLKDHDFNTVYCNEGNQFWCVDPVLFDYTGIDFIRSDFKKAVSVRNRE